MRTLNAIFAMFVLASCTKHASRTVEWFKAHDAERKAVIADCSSKAVPESVECLNAQKAEDALDLSGRAYVKPKLVDFD